MQLFLCACFCLKIIIVCYCVDGENSHSANESVSSLSSQYSKRCRGDNVEEEEVQEDQQEEERANTNKRQRAGTGRQQKSLKNLQMTGGYINHSLNVGQRRGHKLSSF